MRGRPARILGLTLLAAGLLVWAALREFPGEVEPRSHEGRNPGGGEPVLEAAAVPVASEGPQPQAVGADGAGASPSARVGTHLRGTYRRADGHAPPKCHVYLLRKGVVHKERTRLGNLLPLPAVAPAAFDGHFEVEDLSQFWLCVRPAAGGEVLPVFLDGGEIRADEAIDVVLQPGRQLHVDVSDAAGTPLDQVEISVLPLAVEHIRSYPEPTEPTMGSWSDVIQGDSNRLSLSLPYAGPLRVMARKDGYAPGAAIVEAGVEHISFRLTEPRSLIRVRLEDAAAWPGAAVRLEFEDVRYGSTSQNVKLGWFDRGVATFEDVVGPGTYQVRVWSYDSDVCLVGGIDITDTDGERQISARLHRKAGLGRLVVAWAPEGGDRPWCWVRRAVRDWERWHVLPRRGEVLEILKLPVGIVDVLLVTAARAAPRCALVSRVRIEDRADTQVAPPLGPLVAFAAQEAPAQPRRVARVWFETGAGESVPRLIHPLGRFSEPLLFGDSGSFISPGQIVWGPAPSLVVRWETQSGQSGSTPLERAR